MSRIAEDHTHIKGWGIDADPNNDPTYPMTQPREEGHNGYSWDRPPQQPVKIEILRSIERPNITAVHGTSQPPSGLSGMIRRMAYKHSESSYLRWLPLLVADRVNVVEGVLSDLAHGHIPNIFAEKGYGASWKHDRKSMVISMVSAVVVTVAIVSFLASRSSKRRERNGGRYS